MRGSSRTVPAITHALTITNELAITNALAITDALVITDAGTFGLSAVEDGSLSHGLVTQSSSLIRKLSPMRW